MAHTRRVRLTVHGAVYKAVVDVRRWLLGFLRDDLGLTGTKSAESFIPIQKPRQDRPVPELYDEAEERHRILDSLRSGGKRVLDVGVGDCPCLTLTLARAGHHVVAVDISWAALEKARRWVQQGRPEGRVTLLQADAAALPFADGAFRNVTAFDALGHMADLKGVIRELSRVTAQDGCTALGELAQKGREVTGHPPDAGLLDRLRALLQCSFARVSRIEGTYTLLFICDAPASLDRRLNISEPATAGSRCGKKPGADGHAGRGSDRQ